MAQNNAMVKYTEFETEGRAAIAKHVGNSANIDELMSDIALAFSTSKNGALFKAIQTDEGKRTCISAVKLAVSQGLSLNPAHKECSLIPYGTTVTLVVEKAGYIKKAIDTKAVRNIFTEAVYKNDNFKLKKTSDGDDYELDQDLDDRGEFRGAFCCIIMKDGTKKIHYMSYKDGIEHRDRWKLADKNPMWKSEKTIPAMIEKTTIIIDCKKNNIAPVLEMHQADVEQYVDEDGVCYDVEPDISPAQQIADEMGAEVAETVDTGKDLF